MNDEAYYYRKKLKLPEVYRVYSAQTSYYISDNL